MDPTIKNGFRTSEFWVSIITHVLSFLVVFHAISGPDSQTLTDALTKIVTAVFGIIASMQVVVSYIRSRTAVKTGTTLAIVLAVLALAAPAHAQAPRQPCLFGRWQSTQTMLQEIAANQRLIIQMLQNHQQAAPLSSPAPQQPQLIVLGAPLQQIPLGGMPYQQIPLGGPPKQDIPLGTPPKQDIPLGGPPRQDIPLGGPPRQQIDPGTPPRQQIPMGNSPAPMVPPAPTCFHCLWFPVDR